MTIKIKNPREFRVLMVKSGFTQRGLGKATNVSDTTINHLINGKKGCGPEIAAKIREVLKVEFDDIFFIDHDCKSEHISTGTDGQ